MRMFILSLIYRKYLFVELWAKSENFVFLACTWAKIEFLRMVQNGPKTGTYGMLYNLH